MVIVKIGLSKIDFSAAQLRAGDWTNDDGSVDGQSFQELVKSIEKIGLQVPIVVRFIGPLYQIVSGWRRVAAVQLIAERNGTVEPTIYAIVRNISDLEAAAARQACNGYSPLHAADLAFSLHEISLSAIQTGQALTDNQIAEMAGISQSYASRLLRIVRRAPELAKLWRHARWNVSVAQVERISKLDPGLQGQAFAEASSPTK